MVVVRMGDIFRWGRWVGLMFPLICLSFLFSCLFDVRLKGDLEIKEISK